MEILALKSSQFYLRFSICIRFYGCKRKFANWKWVFRSIIFKIGWKTN